MRRRQESRKIGGSGACSLSRANSLQILNMTVEPLMPSRAYSFVHLALFDSVTTDCSDLVDMITNPMDWPAFATEIEVFHRLPEDFEDVRLSHILRSRNGR
ncbi:hypothetical protein Bca4012_086442 [Brassica carinata]